MCGCQRATLARHKKRGKNISEVVEVGYGFVIANWHAFAAGGLAVATFLGILAKAVQHISTIEDFFKKRKQSKAQQDTRSPATMARGRSGRLPLNNLPSTDGFVGRKSSIREVIELIQNNRIIVITGAGGIGKTSLAIKVARATFETRTFNFLRLKRSLDFYAVIMVSARDTILDIDNVLNTIARELGYTGIPQKDLEEKMVEVLSLFKKYKILLIVDNYETITDSAIDKFINLIPEPGKLIITTRHRKELCSGQVPFDIEKLNKKEGIKLIEREMRKRLNIENLVEEDLVDLYKATGGSPLAIKWSIGQINYRGQSLSSITSVLNEAHGELFESIFSDSWKLLSPSSKELLQIMLFFTTTVSRKALLNSSGQNPLIFDDALGQLIELSLIDSNQEVSDSKKRFNLHPLTRSFAQKELEDSAGLKTYYQAIALHYISFCGDRCKLQRGKSGYDEIDYEVPNIMKVLRKLSCEADTCAESLRVISNFSDVVNVFLWSRGYWGERIEVCEMAMKSAEVLENWVQAGRQAYFIGIVHFWQGDYTTSEFWAQKSEGYFEKAECDIERMLPIRLFGLIAMAQGNFAEATAKLTDVLDAISQLSYADKDKVAIFSDWVVLGHDGYKSGIVSIMQELGISSNRSEEFDMAVSWLNNSILLAKSIDDEEGLAISYSHLGHALYGLGWRREAKRYYEVGLEYARKVQRKSSMARCHEGLAKIAKQRRRIRAAERHYVEAIDLFNRLGMKKESAELKGLFERN